MSRFPFLIILIIYFVIRTVINNAAAKKKSANAKTGAAAEPLRGTRVNAPQRARRESAGFDYGRASHNYSHVSKKRLDQVNSYLQAGLIDKKEYYEMLERYDRQDCFDDQ